MLNYKRYEADYLAGIVAAVKTKNNKIGFIGGINYNTMEGQATVLERGAKSINSDIDVKIEWVGSWIDTVKGEAIARNLIGSNF